MPAKSRGTHRIWLGRDQEVAAIDGALTELASGRGSLFLLTGEPGIGKTRLADEVARSASARGVDVHWGRAWEVGGAPSYWPVTQALRSICRGLSDSEVIDAVGPNGDALVGLMPELRKRLPELAGHGQGALDRFQLFDAVNTFLHAAAARAPLVVVLDDLHAVDLSSLLMVQFLVRDLRSRPLMLIGTYREAEARLAPETSRVLTTIAREGSTLPLRRLDREEVAAYIAEATGASPAQERIDALHHQTEGNPLFLRELLCLDPMSSHRPEGVREVVRARLSLLTPTVRASLEIAAVLGRELELDALAAVSGIPAEEARSLLAPAVDAAIVEPLDRSRFRFTHVLLREGIYEGIFANRRAELHRSAALAASRSPGGGALAELAHHLLHAIPLVTAGEAVDAALKAAERAMEVLAFEDAGGLLARAATLLEGAAGEGEERRRFEVWLGLGAAQIRSGNVSDGKLTCVRAAELARSLDDGERFARAVLGSAYEYTPGVRNVELIGLLEEALTRLPPGDGALRARCMAQLAAERQPEPDTASPIALARGAIAMARRVGDKETLRFTLSAASLAMMVYADPDERIALDTEALRLALAAHDKRVALRAHLLLLGDHFEKGDTKGVAAHHQSYTTLAGQFAHGSFSWVSSVVDGALALGQGRWADAERAYRWSEELLQKDPARGASLAALPVVLCSARERYDDLASIESRVRAAFGALRHELGGCIGEMVITQLYGRARDRRRSAAQLSTVSAHPLFAEVQEASWLALLADACHLHEDRALAERLYAALLPRADRLFNLGHLGPAWDPPYARQLGLLAQTLGRLDDAVHHLEAAERGVVAMGMRAHVARARYELAVALLARSRDGDHERASGLLEQARAHAVELEQTALVEWIAERAVAAGTPPLTRPAPDRAPPGFAFTFSREGDYWTIAHGERTARLRDSRGLRLLEQLVTSPGVELHCLQLMGADSGDARADRGDAGSVLDRDAIQSYRTRLLELREELEEAEGFADPGRSLRAKEEMEHLTSELASAIGLGGRERRVGNAAERARTTVQKRVREAIGRIADELPELGTHLEQAVRTGAFCGYFPTGRPRPRRG